MWWKWFVVKVTSIRFVITLIFLTKLLCMILCACSYRESWYTTKKHIRKTICMQYFIPKKKKKPLLRAFIISISWSWWKWHMILYEIEPFNLVLNTTLAYKYVYNSEMRFFFSGDFKQKINKWCLHPMYLYYIYFQL